MPTWDHWLHPPDRHGILAPIDLQRILHKNKLAVVRLNKSIAQLQRDPRVPRRPNQFRQRDIDRIVRLKLLPTRLLSTFWRAFIFDRDDYTCQYCGRSTVTVWSESNRQRTMSLTCDHYNPRMKGGREYWIENTRTACWSCNKIKSTWPDTILRFELKSLAEAVLRAATTLGSDLGKHSAP